MTWRYEFVTTRHPHSQCFALNGGKFQAADIGDAREVPASIVRNIKVSGPTKPDAIRLIDPKGRKVLLGATRECRRAKGGGQTRVTRRD